MTDTEEAELCDWLVRIGYGLDFSTPKDPMPKWLRWPLAHAWYRSEHTGSDADTTPQSYYDLLAEECQWST